MFAITFKFIYCSRCVTQQRFMSSPSFSPVHTLSFVYSLLWVCFTNRTQKSKIVNEIAFSFEFIIRKIWCSTYNTIFWCLFCQKLLLFNVQVMMIIVFFLLFCLSVWLVLCHLFASSLSAYPCLFKVSPFWYQAFSLVTSVHGRQPIKIVCNICFPYRNLF